MARNTPPSSLSANLPRRPSIPVHASLPSCSRLSRSGLETSQQFAPPACRPSLTAARHDSLGNLQAGTERCSRPNQKMRSKRRTECRQPNTLIPRPHLSTKPGQAQNVLTEASAPIPFKGPKIVSSSQRYAVYRNDDQLEIVD